ncbi:MAG: tRNA (guanine-N(1)-)-methyltransferase [Candidatus Peregrinibacteria bacterium GW2011_GWA2_33_10]|nr:MAG: tRNA (guanine-N(1)-)-methyltransferase [Candidatus Peregrinibacteria bacterium GW2011_GWA2_33_10]KKP40772.1 MAG: tRNA (guanine-n(1)-)-methyltransferase, tRNA (guanine37-N1)-methyltransferase [Candidatus Peregrinibacteria bacterium GW2011_GWC2_33_13]OGJ50935.1 MAG: tRNA (guanosine(37)-N1)-methyltransferase TrmD [Candidatus Peregrinibacteria bacterium RIFOXYA2_FULL_33_7]
MKFTVLTLFPDMFKSYLGDSILKRAILKKLIKIEILNIRDFAKDKHKQVDDTPYGGGAGMLLSCSPIFDAVEHAKKTNNGKVIFFSPHGKLLNQAKARKLAKKDEDFILLCGRYEGVDQRVVDALVDEEISIGNYVLTGGELAAMVFVDVLSRLKQGVLGDKASFEEDSFSLNLNGKKEYPQYTKPAVFRGMKVPEVLLSGNHAEIEKWKKRNLK